MAFLAQYQLKALRGTALMAGFEGHAIPGDPAALFAGDRPVESLEEICEYVRGEPGADTCPDEWPDNTLPDT